MKYPCWSDYASVFEGVDLEIHIVDHCNLNCAGCNHFCPLAEPYYIDLEHFKNQLLMVKEKIPSLKWLMLLGGEPTIHPQLLELCEIARDIFPDIIIEILTNGKYLKGILKDKQRFEELDIHITIARYNIQYDEEDVEEVLSMKHAGQSWGRASFIQTLVDINGSQDAEKNFYHHCHHQLPCFTLKDYKIYECPFAAHIDHFCKKFNIDIPLVENNDYLPLETLTLDKLEQFSYQPKNICKYCKPGQNWIWHQSNYSFDEFTKTMKELYLSDYDTYEKILDLETNTMKDILLERVDPNYGLDSVHREKVKYHGKLDIIIPYYNVSLEQITQLAKTLENQTIIKDCMIYLISDNSPYERLVLNYLSDRSNNLNISFLKNTTRQGPGVARNKGIEKSFNKYIFFLDADDTLYNPNTLEQAYNLISSSQYDGIAIHRQDENYEKLSQVDYLLSRNFIEINNIRYGNYFLHEDLLFSICLSLFNARIIDSCFDGVIYNDSQENSITNTTNNIQKIYSKYFTIYKALKIAQTARIPDNVQETLLEKIKMYSDIKNFEEETGLEISDDPEAQEFVYYIINKCITLCPKSIEYIDNSIKTQLLENNLRIRCSSVKTIADLINSVHDYFNKRHDDLILSNIINELKGEDEYEI